MADGALQRLIESGLLGVLLVISITAIVFLYKEVGKERTSRIADLKEVWQNDLTFRGEIKQTLQNILDLLRGK